MTALMSPEPMAKKSSKSGTTPVRIALDVARDAAIVAAYEDKSVPDLLSEILRPVLAKKADEYAAKRLKSSPKP